MKNILVTGAAGFIGANFAELMVKKYEGKYNIVVFEQIFYISISASAFKASEESAQTIFFSFPLFSAVDPCNFIPSGMLVKPLNVIKQRYLKWRRFLPL